jgi:hypothetical protein
MSASNTSKFSKQKPCFFHFTRGCSKGPKCTLSHDPNTNCSLHRCLYYEACTIEKCPFEHSEHRRIPTPVKKECIYFKRGNCTNKECPYLHGNICIDHSPIVKVTKQAENAFHAETKPAADNLTNEVCEEENAFNSVECSEEIRDILRIMVHPFSNSIYEILKLFQVIGFYQEAVSHFSERIVQAITFSDSCSIGDIITDIFCEFADQCFATFDDDQYDEYNHDVFIDYVTKSVFFESPHYIDHHVIGFIDSLLM